MSYSLTDGRATWKGSAIREAEVASFTILTDMIARDRYHVYVLGKPARVDATSFEILSPTYARDHNTIFYLMASKLKPVKNADPASFVPVGDQFGRDAVQAFFCDKQVRLSKKGRLDQLTSLGHAYAHDGATLFFGTKHIQPPADSEIDWTVARLKWLGENDDHINVPPLVFFDGIATWFAASFPSAEDWVRLDGATFETVDTKAGITGRDAPYVQDADHIWFRDGRRVDGAVPGKATRLGSATLQQGQRLWVGAQLLNVPAHEAAFIMRYHSGTPDFHKGDLLHLGDRICLADPDNGLLDIARSVPETRSLDDIADTTLRPILHRLFTILERFLPIVNAPQDISERLDPHSHQYRDADPIAWVDPPEYSITIDDAGAVVLSLSDGTVMRQPASCWYTLGCHLWCHARGMAPELVPFTSTTTVLPKGTEMQEILVEPNQHSLWNLTAALFRAGFKDEAQIMGQGLFERALRTSSHKPVALPLIEIASLPRDMIHRLHYENAHHGFVSTTNLSVARHIIREHWLAADDFRDRLDVLGVLHGTVITTNKKPNFLREIIPAVMARYHTEPLGHVRERIAFVLEAACIGNQVDAEVKCSLYSEASLEVVNFCLENALHTRFNLARRVEILWALDRGDAADAEARALIDAYGDSTWWPGVYGHRPTYRTTKLWLLGAKTRICRRPSGLSPKSDGVTAVHRDRLQEMTDELAALKEAYGDIATGWPEVIRIEQDIYAYNNDISQL